MARRIERLLAPLSVWVEAEREPGVIKVANIQHLATPVHAQLAEPLSAVELAALLHPTPAVGGDPGAVAIELIDELEGLDRGWYAGPIGWMDAAEDGEFCVGLRSALLRDRTAHLYAGAGIVADSDPGGARRDGAQARGPAAAARGLSHGPWAQAGRAHRGGGGARGAGANAHITDFAPLNAGAVAPGPGDAGAAGAALVDL